MPWGVSRGRRAEARRSYPADWTRGRHRGSRTRRIFQAGEQAQALIADFSKLAGDVLNTSLRDLATQVAPPIIAQLLIKFAPATAIAGIVKSVVDAATWLRDNAERLKDLIARLRGVFDAALNKSSAADIAAQVEGFLAGSLPTLLGAVASVLGFGAIPRQLAELPAKIKARARAGVISLRLRVPPQGLQPTAATGGSASRCRP